MKMATLIANCIVRKTRDRSKRERSVNAGGRRCGAVEIVSVRALPDILYKTFHRKRSLEQEMRIRMAFRSSSTRDGRYQNEELVRRPGPRRSKQLGPASFVGHKAYNKTQNSNYWWNIGSSVERRRTMMQVDDDASGMTRDRGSIYSWQRNVLDTCLLACRIFALQSFDGSRAEAVPRVASDRLFFGQPKNATDGEHTYTTAKALISQPVSSRADCHSMGMMFNVYHMRKQLEENCTSLE